MKQRITLNFDGQNEKAESILHLLATQLNVEIAVTRERTRFNAYGDEIHSISTAFI